MVPGVGPSLRKAGWTREAVTCSARSRASSTGSWTSSRQAAQGGSRPPASPQHRDRLPRLRGAWVQSGAESPGERQGANARCWPTESFAGRSSLTTPSHCDSRRGTRIMNRRGARCVHGRV